MKTPIVRPAMWVALLLAANALLGSRLAAQIALDPGVGDAARKCYYQPHPATGNCGEYCLTDCPNCGCGAGPCPSTGGC